MKDTTTRTSEEQPFHRNVWMPHQGIRSRLFLSPYLGHVGYRRILKRVAKEATEMGFNSGKKMEVLYGSEVPRSLMQAEAGEVTREEEGRLQLEHGWVTAC